MSGNVGLTKCSLLLYELRSIRKAVESMDRKLGTIARRKKPEMWW